MRILIPTDFSEHSQYAIEAGIEFSNKFGAHLDIVHFLAEEYSLMDIDFPSGYDPMLDQAYQSLKKISSALDLKKVSHEYILKEAKLYEGLNEILEGEENYDLVIIGSHGKSGYDSSYLGSNAQKVVRKVRHKVLIIKDKPSFTGIKEVAFVTGLNATDKLAFTHFLDFIRPFNPEKIHVLTINTSNYFAQPSVLMLDALHDFKLMTKELDCETHFYPQSSIRAGVKKFSSESQIDLIAISNHVKQPLKRIFRGSNVEAIALESSIPVLTIDFPTPKSVQTNDREKAKVES